MNIEESTKIAAEAKFATLGRAIADALLNNMDASGLLATVNQLRRIEQDNVDRSTRFAALARQLGDATRTGKDTAYLGRLCQELQQLRSHELSGSRA